MPILLFGTKIDRCLVGEGEDREVKGEEEEVMKKVEGVWAEGSGLLG